MTGLARKLVCVMAITVSATTVMAGPSLGAPTSAAGCSASALKSGDCVTWVAVEGQDELEAAVRSTLLLGQFARAYRFLAGVQASGLITQPEADRYRTAVRLEAQAVDSGLEYLDETPPPGQFTTFADQDDNGWCCAISGNTFQLGGWTDYATVEYGYYDANGRQLVGTIRMTMHANVLHDPDVAYYHYIRRYTGPTLYFGSVETQMREDVNNGSDNAVKTITAGQCAIPGSSLNCSANPNSPMVVDNYYFMRLKFQFSGSGVPTFAGEVSSRRWKVGSPTNLYFPAYYNVAGG